MSKIAPRQLGSLAAVAGCMPGPGINGKGKEKKKGKQLLVGIAGLSNKSCLVDGRKKK